MFGRAKPFWTRFCMGGGLVVALLSLLSSRAAADSFLRLEAGATARKIGDSPDKPGFALVPQLEWLFARRHASTAVDGTDDASIAMDTIEIPLVLRSELIIGSRSFHVLAGAYGSIVLRARRTHAGGIIERIDTASPVDVGLVVAGGLELASFAWGELFLEARYRYSCRMDRGCAANNPGAH